MLPTLARSAAGGLLFDLARDACRLALALERDSEANAPLGRAVIGGLIAGLFTVLIIVPALYSLIAHDQLSHAADDLANA
jgi:hypothetical protein